MIITPIKTGAIKPNTITVEKFLDKYVPPLHCNTIVAITSKVISICEGATVKIGTVPKSELIHAEAEHYLGADNTYGLFLTIKQGTLIVNSGIDESNGHEHYILWPKDPMASANRIQKYLTEKYSITNVGVVITDSRTMPLRWGVFGTAIAHAGFVGLKNYIGVEDIFRRPLVHTQANIAEGLAASAVLVMGEGNEQQPIAIIEDVPFVEFTDRPNFIDLIDLEADIYAPLLTSVQWNKGFSNIPE